jgi:pimeloyl-ACP methyl ester carboxylesterase
MRAPLAALLPKHGGTVSSPVRENSSEPAPAGRECAEFGVLFVAGFDQQRPGSAIAAFASALYRWLYRWNIRPNQKLDSSPTLSDTVLVGASGADDGPAHVRLAAPGLLTTEKSGAWLIAESSWADLFTPPGFLGVARWIWKVSTCLLVLQFVIPMHRHWNRAKRKGKSRRRRLADLAMAPCYLVLMAVAAMLSVLISLVLLALAVAEKLPIPRIDTAVRWVAVKVSAVLGDSYMLAHCPVQFAAMRTQVARDLHWLQARCERVAVVAHSQGAAIAHKVLKDLNDQTGNVRAFITMGQGIAKFSVLQHLDWEPRAYRSAWASRVLVTTGMFLAGLPVIGFLLRHWTGGALVKALVSSPASTLLPSAGFVIIGIGVYVAMHAVCRSLEQDLTLPCAGLWWSDYYASADPVSNGPLVDAFGQVYGPHQTVRGQTELLPSACNQVYNSASVLFDHNRYLRNQDQVLSQLINDLAAAAYGDSRSGPRVVCEEDLVEVGRRRHQLILSLIAARILALGLAVVLWQLNLGSRFKGPMNRLVELLAPHTEMGTGFARFTAAILITVVFYIVMIIVWRIREQYVIRRFFRTAERNREKCQENLLGSATRAAEKQTNIYVG